MADWKLGYQANCWGPLGGNAVGVTSVKDLFYRTFGDMERAVADIAAAGYQGVELFDGNLVDLADAGDGGLDRFRSALQAAGLRLLAVYSGGNFIFPEILGEELWRVERAAALAAELQAEHLVVGGGAKRADGPRDGDYGRLAEALDRVVDIAERHGLVPHYHPHLTTIVEGPEQVARIFGLTQRINFCPDTAHLAAAGGDPAQLIRDHAQRIKYVHLKGLRRQPFGFTPLGVGDLDLEPVVRALTELNYDGWITVELDAWEEPRQGAETSRRWLAESIRRHMESTRRA